MFLPTTKEEIKKLGWDRPDIILVSGDAYIDHYSTGIAVLGKLLMKKGYRVGVVCQPDISSSKDISRLGEPKLFWGVSSGCVDSMVANYTATKKPRKSDDFTPGGVNNKRPDRAVIKYTNLIRQNFKNTVPVILGGIEASLRRIAHYDFWSDKLRKSVLMDSKADLLVYGMGEKTLIRIAERIKKGEDFTDLRGVCYLGKESPDGYITLPSFDEVSRDKDKFLQMFKTFYENNEPLTASGLVQDMGGRLLIQNPPVEYPASEELDEWHELDFERSVHPYYANQGEVRAIETVKTSVTSHRGCFGECSFCAIAVHQGRGVRSRSQESISREIKYIASKPGFKGYISDVGGPTANMYMNSCEKELKHGACRNKRCMYPDACPNMKYNHGEQAVFLRRLGTIKGIKKIFVSSGIRHDMIVSDSREGLKYLDQVVEHNTSGQMKIAPEHTEQEVLKHMGKPGGKALKTFRDYFYDICRKKGKRFFLTYYIIAGHPGCKESDMKSASLFFKKELGAKPEQVQIFTPTPSTWSTAMYYTEKSEDSNKSIFVEKRSKYLEYQKKLFVD